jgi:ATP-dependent 26S proteasome regulatory subunit
MREYPIAGNHAERNHRKTKMKTTQTTESATAAIKLTDLNAEQLKQLKAQLKEQSKNRSGNITKRNSVIDKMLHEVAANGEFVHTTADILAALQDAKVITAELSNEDRAAALKMIQTRKQALVKKGDSAVGYKQTPTGISGLTQIERDCIKSMLESLAEFKCSDYKHYSSTMARFM